MRKKSTILIAIALSVVSLATHAETLTEWSFGSSKTSKDLPLCSVYVSGQTDAAKQMMAIQKYSNQNLLNLKLYKESWNIPAGTPITATVDFLDGNSLTLPGEGAGKVVSIEIPHQATVAFSAHLRESSYLQIGFPRGSEDAWRINLEGAHPHLANLNTCSLRQRANNTNTQPF